MTAEDLLPRLDAVSRSSRGYMARCPAHGDKSPSLSIKEGDRGLLLKCWAGCTLDEITAAIGIRVADLFFDTPSSHGCRPTPRPIRMNRVALAFRFELAALDRRLRAERVIRAVTGISMNEFPDHDLDRLIGSIGRTYADIDRAELLGAVADGLRFKDFAQRERRERHAA